ncbi:MAG: choice-of-anchor X domain-containing protein [Thermoplasmatota archaeon]
MAQGSVSRRSIAIGIVFVFLVMTGFPFLEGRAATIDHRGARQASTPLMDQIEVAKALAAPTLSPADGVGTTANDCIQPPKNTLGWTCSGGSVGEWKWDTGGSYDISVDMGDLANMDKVSGNKGYKLEFAVSAVAWYWYDGNGAYNPITDPTCSNGGQFLCDDAELTAPFDVYKIAVNGQDFVTQQGWHEQILAENDRFFEFKPIGDDPVGTYHVPANMLHSGVNTITLTPLDAFPEYAGTMPYHSAAADGWEMNIAALRMQLVAPPLFISHGWGFEWDPAIAMAAWQPTLAQAMHDLANQNLAQDPWQWTKDLKNDANGGIYLNVYDNKQNWRFSAITLGNRVTQYKQQLGYSGKVWLAGHSMGGIVSRSYTEEFGGSANVAKIFTLDTPHTGSPFADFYTHFFWQDYKAYDGALTAHYLGVDLKQPAVPLPIPGFGDFPVRPMPGATFLYWRDWWRPSIGANAYQFFGVGRDHLADFGIKPSGVSQTFSDPVTGLFTIHTMPSNPLLDQLNAKYPASGVDYFATVGLTTSLGSAGLAVLLQTIGMTGYFVGDAIVPADSEDMNGAVPSRPVAPATHLNIMDNPDARNYMFRFFYGLDIDSGDDMNAPAAPAALADALPVATPAPPPPPGIPQIASAAATHHTTMPTTEGDVVFVQRTDLVNGNYDKTVTIDSTVGQANFTVWTRPDMGPLNVSIIDPDGIEYTKSVGIADRAFMYGETQANFPLKARTFYVTAPKVGVWTIRVHPVDDVPTDGLPIFASAVVDSSIDLIAGTDADRYHGGDTATLRATVLKDGVALPGASVNAHYVDDAGIAHDVTLFDDGTHGDLAANDGYYANTVTLPATEGSLEMQVTATGNPDGLLAKGAGDYVRERAVPILIASEPDLTVAPSDITTNATKPWAGDPVQVTVNVRNIGERDSDGGALVLSDNGVPIATLTTNATIPRGGSLPFVFNITSPAHVSTLTASITPLDLDLNTANNVASVPLGNVPTARTVADAGGAHGLGDWFTGPVAVTLAPWHGLTDAGSQIYASVDGAPAQPYASPLVFTSDGRHTVDYHAVASTGDVEPTRTLAFGIDTVAPTVAIASPAPGTVNALVLSASDTKGYTIVAGVVQLDIPAADATSGLARLDVLVDGQVLASTTASTDTGYEYLWDSTTASMGNHILTVRVSDAAGLSSSASQHVYVLVSRNAEVDHNPNDNVARLTPQPG